MELVVIYVIVVAVFAGLPSVIDIIMAYRSHDKARALLIQRACRENSELTDAKLEKFIKEITKSPPGISGLSRASMALTVIVILGIAVFHLLVTSEPGENTEIISNVLSLLGGLLAAITGFYFGGKGAEKAKEEAEKVPGARELEPPTPPTGMGS